MVWRGNVATFNPKLRYHHKDDLSTSPHRMGAHDAHRQALLAREQQRLVHLVKGLVEGLDLVHPLVA